MTFDRCATSRTSTSTSASMKSGLPVDDLQAGDCAFLLGDRVGQVGERCRLVGADHADPRRVVLRLAVAAAAAQRGIVPVHLDEALRRRGKAGQRLAVAPVDRHALAGGDDADDVVARHRMAAAGEVIRHARHQSGDRHIEVGPCGCRPCRARRRRRDHARRTRRLPQFRIGGVHHVLRADIAVADRNIEIVHRGVSSAPSAPAPAPSPTRRPRPGGTPSPVPRAPHRDAAGAAADE